MLFARINNGLVDKYPYTESDLRADFPQTSFPSDLTGADLSEFGVFPVTEITAPTVDHTQVVFEGDPVNVGDNWTQVWVVRDATNEEEAAALARIEKIYEHRIQSHLDQTARSRGYDNILSACSYAAGAHPKFSVEGQDCIAWRSAVWEAAFQIMADVKSGARPVPTIEQVLSELPAIVWSI